MDVAAFSGKPIFAFVNLLTIKNHRRWHFPYGKADRPLARQGSGEHSNHGREVMKTPIMSYVAAFGRRRSIVIMAAALTAAAVSGWARSTMLAPPVAEVETLLQLGSGGHYELPPLW
jgi:hypothetical protein